MPTKSWADLMQDAGGAGGNYDPIPDGDYDFIVEECDAKTSQNGKMMYVAKNKVESGPHAGRLVWHNHVISHENPNALAWFFRNMKVLGLGQEFFAQNPSDHQVAENLKGKRFRGNVTTRKWQGQDKNEIKQFYTAGAGTLGNGLPAPAAPAPQFAAAPAPQFAAPAPAAPAPAAAPAPPPAAPAPAPAPAPVYAAPPAAAQPPAPAPAAVEAAPPPPPPVQQQEAPAPVAPPELPAPAAPPAPAVAAQATGDVPPPPPF